MSTAYKIENIVSLIDLAKHHDAKAQSELIVLTQQRLFKFCLLLGNNRELAEDLCQEAYIKAFSSLEKLNAPDSFYAWLCQIAKNLFFDHKRKKKEEPLSEEAAEKAESTDQQMESVIQVQKVLRTFDPDDRYLLLLVELEGMSYRETAEMLKTTEDAVRSKLHRLRQEFVKKLKE